MSCNIPEHAQLEEELNETLDHAVQLEEELAEAQLQVSNATAAAEVAGEATASEVEAMRRGMESMSRERDRYRDDYMTHRDRVTDIEAQLEDMDHKLKDHEKQRRKLDDDIEVSRKMAQEERAKAANATKRLVELEKRGRSEQRDQVSLLSELQGLRERTDELEAQLLERDTLIGELSLGNQQLVELNDDLSALNETQRGEISELKGTLQDVEAVLSDTQGALVVSKEAEDEYERRLDEIQAGKIRHLTATDDQSNATPPEEAGVLDALRNEVHKLKEDISERDQALEQNAKDLVKLSWQVEHGERRSPAEVITTDTSSLEIIDAFKKKVKAQSDALKDEAFRYKELEERKNAVDTELSNVEAWKERYEDGYGLADALSYQNQLENDIKRLESELVSRAHDLGEALDVSESMDIMCERLREEAGRPAGFLYDDLDVLKKDRKNHIEKLLSIQFDMQTEIGNLNEERLVLLEKLQRGNNNYTALQDTTTTGKIVVPTTPLENETTTVPISGNVSLVSSKGNETVELRDKVKVLECQVALRNEEIEELKKRSHHLEQQSMEQEKRISKESSNNTTGTETEADTSTEFKFDLFRMEEQNKNLQRLIEDLPNRLSNCGIVKDPSADTNAALQSLNRNLLLEVQNITTKVAGELAKGIKAVPVNACSQPMNEKFPQSKEKMIPSVAALAPPTLPHFMPLTTEGRAMLKSQLRKLHLPSEEWAEDVMELVNQFVYSLEQLEGRERELDDNSELLKGYEDHLKSIRAQVSALYAEHAAKTAASEKESSELRKRIQVLEEERDTLLIRVTHMSQVLKVQKQAETGEDVTAPVRMLRDLSRRVMIHEVNEQTLTRRYASMKEQYELEKAKNENTESDAIESNAAIRMRVVYLEEFKSGALERLQRMQQYINESVPRYELNIAHRAIDLLRERLVDLVEREADARVQLAELNQRNGADGMNVEQRKQSLELVALEQKLTENIAAKKAADGMLVKQKELSTLAMKEAKQALASINKGSMLANFNGLVEEVTKSHRAVAASQVEQLGLENKLNIAQTKLLSLDKEFLQLRKRCVLLEERKNQAVKDSFKAKQDLDVIKDTFEGGATGDEVRTLHCRITQLESQREGLRREVTRCRELADVATEQAQALGHRRSDQDEEINALRSQVSELEFRSDDDIIIGTLQRKLMATKSAYKAFVRKFESMRGGLRKKSAALHVLEARLDAKDEALMKAQDTHHVQVSALKKALWEVSNRDISNMNGGDESCEKMCGGGRPENNIHSLINVSRLTKILETKTTELEAVQRARIDAEAVTNRVNLELTTLKSLVEDLKRTAEAAGTTITTTSNPSKPDIAYFTRRIISLSDELKLTKLEAFESKRSAQMISEEKRNLEVKVNSLEEIIREIEKANAALETQQLLLGSSIPESSNNTIGQAIYAVEMVTDGSDTPPPYPAVLLSPLKGKEMIELGHDSEVVMMGCDNSIIERDVNVNAANGTVSSRGSGERVSSSSNSERKIVALTKALASSKRSLQGALKRADAAEHVIASMEKERNVLEMQKLGSSSLRKRENDVDGLYQDGGGDLGGNVNDLDVNAQSAKMRNNCSSLWLMNNNNSSSHDDDDETKKTNELKEAAAVTIKTLKGLLSEKNEELDILRNKLDMKRNNTVISIDEEGTAAERSAMDQLNDKIYEESRDSILQLREAAKQLSNLPVITQGDGGGGVSITNDHHNHIVNQLDNMSALLANKQEIIHQLEVKLRTTTNRLTRSEARCSEMIKERNRMASEFQVVMTSNRRLEEGERNRFAVTTTTGTNPTTGSKEEKRIRELQLTVTGKETQIKKLRTALSNLKKEFVRAQESAAELTAGLEKNDAKKQRCHSSQLERISRQNEVLARDVDIAMKSLKKAKEHEEKKTKTLEALQHERNALQHENSGLVEKLTEVQASLTASQTEVNELKELQRGVGGIPKKGSGSPRPQEVQCSSTGEDSDIEQSNHQLVELRARVQLLSAQNASLCKAIDREGGEDFSNILAEAQAAAVRAEKHRSWELENKLRQRGDTLEKRLDEKIKEVMELEAKLFQKSGRGVGVRGVGCGERVNNSGTAATKENVSIVSRFTSTSNNKNSGKGKVVLLSDKKAISETTRVKKQEEDMLVALEKARRRIFELEEEMQILRRKAEVELPAEISTLSCRLRAVRMQLEESDASRILAEQQLKANRCGDPIDEEIWQNEALRDELKALKEKQRELDADICDRDASAMSLRFDLESANMEVGHLKRRNAELMEILSVSAEYEERRRAYSIEISPLKNLGKRMRCGGQDVEGVIDAMKVVIEKLKVENERLKRAAADAPRVIETERKLRLAKSKVAELQEEISSLKAKVQAGDESVSLLARKREQYNLITRKLRTRESELEDVKKTISNIQQSHGQLELEVGAVKKQILNWPIFTKANNSKSDHGSSSSSLTLTALLCNAHEEISNLLSRLAGMERDKERMAGRIRKAEGDQGAYFLSIQAEMNTLEEENDRLRSELEPFDLAFFEEIEDLKHEHAMALDRLRQFEASAQSVD